MENKKKLENNLFFQMFDIFVRFFFSVVFLAVLYQIQIFFAEENKNGAIENETL